MGANTSIQWADCTFNPLIGCAKKSAGCANCYAERDFDRRKKRVKWGTEAQGGTRRITSPENWRRVTEWNRLASLGICMGCAGKPPKPGKPECSVCLGTRTLSRRPRVFVASLADWAEAWGGPILTHTLGASGRLLLAKRWAAHGGSEPWNVWGELKEGEELQDLDTWRFARFADVRQQMFRLIRMCPFLDFLLLTKRIERVADLVADEPPFQNAWIGTSVENQEMAEERVPELAAVKHKFAKAFLSCEPLLGPLDFSKPRLSAFAFVDWVICGGESGPNARHMHPLWALGLQQQCEELKIRFFFKQWGEWSHPYELSIMEREKGEAMYQPGHFIRLREDMGQLRVGTKAAGNLLQNRKYEEFPV